MYKIALTTIWVCDVCKHKWIGRFFVNEIKEVNGISILTHYKPAVCPNCKSRKWDTSTKETDILYKIARDANVGVK